MSIIERGVKRRCGSCEAPFYDMGRRPILCPKCSAVFEPTAGKRLASVPRPPKGRSSKGAFGAKSPPVLPTKEASSEEAPAAETESDDDAKPDADEPEEAGNDEAGGDAAKDDGDDNVTGAH